MATITHACISILCDGGCPDQGWPEGIVHFDPADLQAELQQLREDDWIIIDDRALCPTCATAADCAATGHQWDGPWDADVYDGIPFEYRACEHCSTAEFDPPWPQVQALAAAARIVDSVAPHAKPDAPPAATAPEDPPDHGRA